MEKFFTVAKRNYRKENRNELKSLVISQILVSFTKVAGSLESISMESCYFNSRNHRFFYFLFAKVSGWLESKKIAKVFFNNNEKPSKNSKLQERNDIRKSQKEKNMCCLEDIDSLFDR